MPAEEQTYFEEKWAPVFVVGTALFAIFWGIVNALLVSDSLFKFLMLRLKYRSGTLI